MPPAKPELITLRIELRDVEPLVWRRIIVPGAWSLELLHEYLQWVMGWENAHAYEFHVGDLIFAPSVWINEMARNTGTDRYRVDKKRSISKLVTELGIGSEFEYHYDMGDGWVHRLVLEETAAIWSRVELPIPMCTAGENACPPEDVGGPPGFANFLECLANPSNKGHADMLQWIGGVFDPKGFDLNQLNRSWHAEYGDR
jgi:hypothetical protein